MLSGKFLTKMCVLGASAYFLTGSMFADDNNGKTPTDQINVYEQDDEKQTYTKHGFTRGDMSYLYDTKFDPSQVESVGGQVTKVMRVQYPDNDCYLIAVLHTKANNGEMAVNLGPIWFIEENNMEINEGDDIQITGAKMRTNGRFLIIATELTKNGKTLNIRDKEGAPLWGSPKSQKGNAECMKLNMKKKNSNYSSSSTY